MKAKQLRITEVFVSLQGEAQSAGLPTVFVRLTGCPLRCTYCDSEYAFFGGERFELAELLAQIDGYGVPRVCVTGGEPLSQPACLDLLQALCDRDYEVSLETSGALPIEGVDSRVSRVMDLKTPGSGEAHRNRYENIDSLGPNDQLKFVICDRADYEWARFKLTEFQLDKRVGEVLFSSSHEQLPHRDLADWIVADRLPVRFQMQLHKLLWGDQPGV
ncbi:MAG: 7-carboxy-7-deazaguanine synthase QueE [Cellvibrionaceae bacterium]|nr:7-carboxy-7-deazaguanine synthase QueE [Cellvibrionaceae bacterium]